MTAPSPFRPRRPRAVDLGGTALPRWVSWIFADLDLDAPPEDATREELIHFWYWRSPRDLLPHWRAAEAKIVTLYVARFPGRRPNTWWRFSAPEPRRQVGGDGERVAHDPHTKFGIPLKWRRVNEADRPIFEAQATYVKRYSLLLPCEAERLQPRDFEPEPLPQFTALEISGLGAL